MAFYVKELQRYCLWWPPHPFQGWVQTTQRKNWDRGWAVHHQLTAVSVRGHYCCCCTKPPANSLFTLQPLMQKMPAYPPLSLRATAVTFWLLPIHETSNLAITPSVRDEANTQSDDRRKKMVKYEGFHTWNSHLLATSSPKHPRRRETLTNRF